jgi:hypothetical protein
MLDGSVRTEENVWDRHSTGNSGYLDLFVESKEAGEEVASHLRAAILACR